MRTAFRLPVCMIAVALITSDSSSVQAARAQGVIPGTGTLIDYVGDNFEDTEWSFVHHFPKSSREEDERLRSPTGYSTNQRWIEGPERGQPDHMKVVPTPKGGLPGSKHALLLRTLNSGIPGYHSRDVQQDDLVANCLSRLSMSIPAGDVPSVVTRVYLPPADQWEDRTGPHFGFRISTSTTTTTTTGSRGLFSSLRTTKETEPYWPGIWIHFRSKSSRNVEEDSAFLAIRGNRRGQDVKMLDIPADKFGWWTLGMSVTSDGQIHYFAKQGVEDLTAADHIASEFPYSFQAERFRTFFFNVCNNNDGRTWSTPFVIDDPQLFVLNSDRVVSRVRQKQAQEERRAQQLEARRKAQEEREQAMQERRERQLQAREARRTQQSGGQQTRRSNRSRSR